MPPGEGGPKSLQLFSRKRAWGHARKIGKSSVDVPVTKEPVFKYHFCRNCRKLLADQSGYVIADLYVHGQPKVIPVTDGMEQELRCYKITAAMNAEDNVIELKVEGTYKN